jgi:hypothetical protein
MPQEAPRSWIEMASEGRDRRLRQRCRDLLVECLEARLLLSLAMPTPSLAPADATGTPGENITNVKQPFLVGNWIAGDTIQIATVGVTVLGQSVVAANGTYSVQFSSPLPDGLYAFRVQSINPSGKVDGTSPVFELEIKSAIPPVPAAPAIDVSQTTGTPNITTLPRPTFSGVTEPGAFVNLLNAQGNVIGTTISSIANGSFSVQPGNALPLGVSRLHLQVHDDAGNVSPPGPSATIRVISAPDDFSGQGVTDRGVFRPSTGQWIVQLPNGSFYAPYFGASNLSNIPVPGDYDGVGHAELAVYYPSTATWAVSGPNGGYTFAFGAPNLYDIPVPGDYDGVGHTEFAVFRPSTAQWIIDGPKGVHVTTFGAPNMMDIPVPGDYDGVGHAEPAVFRPSTGQWFVLGPNGGHILSFGGINYFDIPVPGDYDGVGYTEPAVFRPSTGQWFIDSPNGVYTFSFGAPNLLDIPLEAPIASLVRLGLTGGELSSQHPAISVLSTSTGRSQVAVPATPVASSARMATSTFRRGSSRNLSQTPARFVPTLRTLTFSRPLTTHRRHRAQT